MNIERLNNAIDTLIVGLCIFGIFYAPLAGIIVLFWFILNPFASVSLVLLLLYGAMISASLLGAIAVSSWYDERQRKKGIVHEPNRQLDGIRNTLAMSSIIVSWLYIFTLEELFKFVSLGLWLSLLIALVLPLFIKAKPKELETKK